MADKQITRIEALISAISNLQIAIESSVDSDLGYRMMGYKDSVGVARKLLSKNLPGWLSTLRLTGSSTTTDTGLLRHDVNGDVSGGQMTVADFNSYLSDGPIGAGAHNSTTGIQGGATGDNYHFTNAEHTSLRGGNETTLHKHDAALVTGLTAGRVAIGNGTSGISEDSNLSWDGANQIFSAIGRTQGTEGPSVASAADITLGAGNYFSVTGSTTIQRILGTNWTAGSSVKLRFVSDVILEHGVAAGGGYYGFYIQGESDMSIEAGRCVCLCFDGTYWRDLSPDGSRRGEMYGYEEALDLDIGDQDVYHGIYGLSAGTLSGWTFDAGRIVDSNIVNEIDATQLQIETSSAHNLTTGDIVTHHDMNNAAHDGPTAVTVINTTNYTCDDIAYVGGAGASSGVVVEPSYLEAQSTAKGDYLANISISGNSSGPAKSFKSELFKNSGEIDKIVAPFTASSSSIESGSSAGFISIAEGDRVWIGLENTTDGTTFTLQNANVNLHRI